MRDGNPGLRIPLSLTSESGTAEHDYFLYSDDGSWSEATPIRDGGHVVTQGGPRRVWDSVERAVDHWRRLGEPGRGRYGVTVTTDGTHRYWVDRPELRLFADGPDPSRGSPLLLNCENVERPNEVACAVREAA
jgi:hypothetical protein